MSGYRAKFDRISRNHNVPDLAVAGDAQSIAEQVYRYAKPKMASREVEVVVELDELRGMIFCGMHVGGTFVLEPMA